MAFVSAINTGFYDLIKLWPETWQADTAYASGNVVKATSYNDHSFKCTTAGTSGSSEPTWDTDDGDTTTDNTVTWTTWDARAYQIKAPQDSVLPYITFGLLTESPIGTFQDFEAIENLTYWINCFSDKGVADLAEIADEVMDSLDDKTITATGYTSMRVIREFISAPTFDFETNIFMLSLRYRLWLSRD